MHLWAHFTFICYCKRRNNNRLGIPRDDEKLFSECLFKLSKLVPTLFTHFQKYVEDQDKQKLVDLLNLNPHLIIIVSAFVNWYYKGDPERAHVLFAVARAIQTSDIHKSILVPLNAEMKLLKKIHTFEAFCMFSMVKKQKLPLNDLPDCLRLLLNPSSVDPPLQLVNKFFNMPLRVQDKQVFCFVSEVDEEQIWSAEVDLDTALTTFSLKSSDACRQLDASAPDGMVTLAEKGTQWMIKPVDEHYFKIFTEDGTVNICFNLLSFF